MKSLNIMKKIDTTLYKEIQKIENSENYQKISDFYSALEEVQQRVLKLVLMGLVILLPFLVVFLFASSNQSLEKEVQMKKNLIISANTLVKSKIDLKNKASHHISSQFVETEGEIKKKILGMLNLSGVDSSKVKISAIEINPEANLITKIKADVKFDSMGNVDLFTFFNNLTSKLRIRFDEISIKKNDITKLLDGVFTIHYFSKTRDLDE